MSAPPILPVDDPAELTSYLTEQPPSGLYRWPTALSPRVTVDAATRAGWRVEMIDTRIRWDKHAFLRQCAQALDFPDWFGDNWDALTDCLRDVEVPTSSGLLITWRGWGAMARMYPADYAVATEILGEFADDRANASGPIIVALR